MLSFVWIYFWFYCIYVQFIQTGKIIHNINHLKNKKIVSISPGGYKGFYTMGIASYIKDHYNMTNCIFSGASAGAWISLFMTYKGNNKKFIDTLEIFCQHFYSNSKNLFSVEQKIKQNLLSNFKTEDFDLSKLFIGVVQIDNIYHINTHIYTKFDSLEDAINCCISSSHIPFVTGNIFNVYNNKYTFDGGFSSFPYLHSSKDNQIFHIHPTMWKEKAKINENRLCYNMNFLYNFRQILLEERMNFHDLYKSGYNDSIRNKEQFDKFFILK